LARSKSSSNKGATTGAGLWIFRHWQVIHRERTAPGAGAFARHFPCERGLLMKEGTLVDATIIEAPPSTRNAQSHGLEDALYDSIALRAFAGIDPAVEDVPDATTLLKFRRLLVGHELTGNRSTSSAFFLLSRKCTYGRYRMDAMDRTEHIRRRTDCVNWHCELERQRGSLRHEGCCNGGGTTVWRIMT
jgi:transposase-like protein DUF772